MEGWEMCDGWGDRDQRRREKQSYVFSFQTIRSVIMGQAVQSIISNVSMLFRNWRYILKNQFKQL